MAVTDYYRLLGVPRDASADDIKARLEERRHVWMQRQHAFRPEQRTEAERNLGLVPKIKEVLLDQRARKAYDAELRTATPEPADLGDRPDDADLLSEGWRCVADGRIAAALALATRLTTREGDNADGWALLAHCRCVWGEFDEGVADYRKAVRLRPDDAHLHYNLGCAYLEIEDWAQAQRHFNHAAEIEPGNAAHRALLGTALVGAGQHQDGLPQGASPSHLRTRLGWHCRQVGVCWRIVGATPVLDRMEFFQESRRDGGDLPPHRRSGGPLSAPLRQLRRRASISENRPVTEHQPTGGSDGA